MMSSPLRKVHTFCVSILRHGIDALFPIRCLGCGAFDTWLCQRCHTTLPLIVTQHCPYCQKNETPYGNACFTCAPDVGTGYDAVAIASRYDDPLVRKAIHMYKYRFARELATPLALLLAQNLQHTPLPVPDIIIPVPLHARRLRWRGFNQAELLAKELHLQIPLEPAILKRRRYTQPQVTLRDRRAREENLRNAFTVTQPHAVHGKTILLIDDVITTGSTLTHCAAALKDAGARHVYCLVLARH